METDCLTDQERKMVVREATINDLPLLAEGAREFYKSSQFLEGFSLPIFERSWVTFIEKGIGKIFLLTTAEGVVAGALGAFVSPDICNGELVATEFFWFVREDSRGAGLVLLKLFEQWAKLMGCTRLMIVHLLDSMPEKLNHVYRRFGYTPAEVHYVKRIKPCQSEPH